jgi:hypothetical protein
MNRKISAGILLALTSLAFGFLTGCSSSSSAPTVSITASSGSGQSQTVNEAFPNPLIANVTSNGSPASGVTVTFAVPSSGASCTPSATTGTTDSNGNVTINCTANGSSGGYAVTASVSGATTSAQFSETNAAPSVFVFYVSGLENGNLGVYNEPNYYAIAGAVGFDLSGNLLGGEQDYNDGVGFTSPEPTPDTIMATGSSMTINQSSGTGTLVLVTNNANVGVSGTETFAVQFINSSHALITQFDGSATSSGSMDLQSATSVSGNYAFTLSGVDVSGGVVGYGGVFADASGVITGTVDENDSTNGELTGTGFSATDNGVPSTDAYGRGTISGFGDVVNDSAISLVYYVVGPEAVRLIDVDTTDSAVGSAYGQGSGTFDSTALGTADVFGIQGNPWGFLYAASGQVVTSGAASGTPGATLTGEGDVDEEGGVTSASSLTASYTIASNGYGSVTSITGLEDVTGVGLYATDPALNLMDPNNTSGGGGALLLDLDIPGGTGVAVPQAATTAAADLNTSYGFGAQDFNGNETLPASPDFPGWEFDYVGQGGFDTSLDLTGTLSLSDPFGYFVASTQELQVGEPIAGTASGPDASGRYTYTTAVAIGPVDTNTTATSFTEVMYEANPALVFSLDEDSGSLWLGTYQQQSTTGSKAFMKGKKAAKATVSRKH